MKSKTIKIYSLFIIIFFLAIGILGAYKSSFNSKEVSTKKRSESYELIYKEVPVTFLRKSLNAYLINDSSKVCILQVAVTKSDGKNYGMEEITSGLEAFDKSYYKSKFVVATYDDNKETEGSKNIQIIFRDKPDRIFYAWIGRNPQGEICLLGFNSRNDIDPVKLQETIKSTEPYFSNPDLAI